MKLSEKQFGNWDIAVRRNLFMPVNRSVSDVAEKRKDWNGLMSGFKASDLVFLDESGCNTDTVSDCSGWFHFCGYAL